MNESQSDLDMVIKKQKQKQNKTKKPKNKNKKPQDPKCSSTGVIQIRKQFQVLLKMPFEKHTY